MNKAICVIGLSLLGAASAVTRAEAVPVGFSGIPGNWSTNAIFSVEVIVTGLDAVDVLSFKAPAHFGDWPHVSAPFPGNQVDLNWTSLELHGLRASHALFVSGPGIAADFDGTRSGTGEVAFDILGLSHNDGTASLSACLPLEPCPVPEAGTLALFGAALSALGVRRFRRT